jgi:hypothetical protein
MMDEWMYLDDWRIFKTSSLTFCAFKLAKQFIYPFETFKLHISSSKIYDISNISKNFNNIIKYLIKTKIL